MTHKSKIFLSLAIVLMLAAGVIGFLCYRDYHATYLIMDSVKYRRDLETLDLSGKSVTEFEKLRELTGLKQLNLQETGITTAQYDKLHEALPACDIVWSVPFQDGYIASSSVSLQISELSEEDFDAISYLSALTSVQAEDCDDYDAILALKEQHPELEVSYSVDFGEISFSGDAETLDIIDPDPADLEAKLPYLPQVRTVSLSGTLPENDVIMELVKAHPDITFVWDFEVFGVPVNSLTETLNLSHRYMTDTKDVEAILPYFYNLKKVEMLNCGLSNEVMEDLNVRYPGIRFVWYVSVCGINLRTDARYFVPVKYRLKDVSAYLCRNLKYCHDIEVIDMGHYGISNVDFVEQMPKLKYLLLCDASLTDLTAVGNCTSLEFLELFQSRVTDFWPLTNLTNLRDLNLAGVPCFIDGWNRDYGTFGDYTPLLQMPWLDRLWLNYNHLNRQTRADLQEALPNTVLLFDHGSHTGGGFRHTPHYYQQRDIIGMGYKVG